MRAKMLSKALILAAPLALATVATTNDADAATVDYFLKVEGVDGESTDAAHKNEIDLHSFSWGVSQLSGGARQAGGGGGAGKSAFQDFTFTHNVDKASPALALYAANGSVIKKATLVVRRGDGNKGPAAEFLKITFEDVLVTSVKIVGASESQFPQEEVALNFSKVKWEYFQPDARGGSNKAAGSGGWDLKQSKAY